MPTSNQCSSVTPFFVSISLLGFALTRNGREGKPPSHRIINRAVPHESHQTTKKPPTKSFISKKPTPKNATSSTCLKNAFKDLLLVVVYNYPFYDSIPHLVSLYKPAFPHLLFCGPPDDTERSDILAVEIIRGLLGYECLGRAIRKYPGYKGYFYISDDVLLKYWKFPDFDRSKIWESSSIRSNPVNEPPKTEWYWWASRYGLESCRSALLDVAKMTFKEAKLNGKYLLSTLLKNSGGIQRCFGSRSDVLYIPQKHANAFSILSKTFYRRRVFLEIAVPTIIRLLVLSENITRLPGYYIPGKRGDPRVSDSRFFWYLYFPHKEYSFIHPFKLHREEFDSKFNLVMLKFVFIEKIKQLTKCTPNLL